MMALLTEGFTGTFRSISAALRLFWPIAVLTVLTAFVGPFRVSGNFKTDPLGSSAIVVFGLSFVIYLFLILCQGAVGWHRKLLLNEQPTWVSLIPSRRSLQYAVPVVIFVLLLVVGLILALMVTQSYQLQLITTAYTELKITGNPTAEQLEALRLALVPLAIVKFVAGLTVVSALLWLGQSWLLAFPHISVRDTQPVWGKISYSVARPTGLIGALLIVYFLPSIFGLLYGIGIPVNIQLKPMAILTVTLVSSVLSMICFLWGLTILSLAYRKVVAREVSYEQASSLAQT